MSPLDLELERRARQIVPTMAGAAQVEFLSGWPLPDLVTRIAAEPADTIVLYLTQFRDRDGRPYVPREVLHAITTASPAPVYGLFETYIGFGIAAGNMEFYEDRGRLVGQLVRDAIADRPAAPAPGGAVSSVPSRCVVDARALLHWSLDVRRLPEGCDIRFADHPYWREHFWQLVAILAVIAAQTLLIGALLIQRRRRQIVEEKLRLQLAQEIHLHRSATAGALSASIAHELNQPLGAILSNAEAAELYLDANPPNLTRIKTILSNIRKDDQHAADIITHMRGLLKDRSVSEFQYFQLNDILKDAVEFIAPEAITRGVELSTHFAQGVRSVHVDKI